MQKSCYVNVEILGKTSLVWPFWPLFSHENCHFYLKRMKKFVFDQRNRARFSSSTNRETNIGVHHEKFFFIWIKKISLYDWFELIFSTYTGTYFPKARGSVDHPNSSELIRYNERLVQINKSLSRSSWVKYCLRF